MKLVAQLEDLLYRAQTKPAAEIPGLAGWRIVVDESKAISLGIKDNIPGTVYTPPGFRQSENGEVFLVWTDGRCSQVRVQNPAGGGAGWLERLKEWRLASYEDAEGSFIPAPEPLPLVAVEERAIQQALAGEDQLLFEQLARLLRERPADVDLTANIQAGWGYRHVRTSTGLAVTYQESQYLLSYSFDRLVGAGFAKRRLIRAQEWEDLWQRMVSNREILRQTASPVTPTTTVIFAGGMVEQLLEHFIVPNFSGQNILDGQSAFPRESFVHQAQVFERGVDIELDPLRPFEWGSYLVSPEGVAARRTGLIAAGRLQTPYLRVKDARRWGAQPTAVPSGGAGLYLRHAREESWPEAIRGVEDGVLVLSVLGLHTQDAVAGRYSLSAPHSLRIQNGQIMGRTDIKLNGSFFADLEAETTRYARSAMVTQPYMLVRTGVQGL